MNCVPWVIYCVISYMLYEGLNCGREMGKWILRHESDLEKCSGSDCLVGMGGPLWRWPHGLHVWGAQIGSWVACFPGLYSSLGNHHLFPMGENAWGLESSAFMYWQKFWKHIVPYLDQMRKWGNRNPYQLQIQQLRKCPSWWGEFYY